MLAKLVERFDHHGPVAVHREPARHVAEAPVFDCVGIAQLAPHEAQDGSDLLDRFARLVDSVVARAGGGLAEPGGGGREFLARNAAQPLTHRFAGLQTISHPPVLVSA